MTVVVLAALDAVDAAMIARVEREVAAVTGVHRPFDSPVGPHVTLGAWDRVDVARAGSALAAVAAEISPVRLRLDSFGVFPGERAVLFAAPVVTAELLALHAQMHRQLADATAAPVGVYRPGEWVPHCTLAEGVARAALPEALEVAMAALPLPRTVQAGALQLAAFPDARILQAAALRGSR